MKALSASQAAALKAAHLDNEGKVHNGERRAPGATMDAQTATIVNTPTFPAAVEATLAFWAVKGDRRTRTFKEESDRLSTVGANALRKVAAESGVRNLGIVQDVVTAAAHVARDAR